MSGRPVFFEPAGFSAVFSRETRASHHLHPHQPNRPALPGLSSGTTNYLYLKSLEHTLDLFRTLQEAFEAGKRPARTSGMPLAEYTGGIRETEDWTMRKNGIDKLAFLVVLGATALVVLAAFGTGPAYSDDSRTDPAEMHRVAAAKTSSAEIIPVDSQPEPAAEEPQAEAKTVDPDGYEWSGSRPADQRYLWSHRPN